MTSESTKKTEAVFDIPLLSEADIRNRYIKARCAFWLVMLASALVLYYLSFEANGVSMALAWALAVKILIWCLIALVASEIPPLKSQRYSWLPESLCGDLAHLCEENAGLVAYRDRVRAQGRRFTVGEYLVMLKWVIDQKQYHYEEARAVRERADCQRLYGTDTEHVA